MKRISEFRLGAACLLAAWSLLGAACAEEDAAAAASAQERAIGLAPGEVIAHDPVMIRRDGVYYLFTTGPGITVWSSPDMKRWDREDPVFAEPPAWAQREVPGFNGHIWAPDISYHDGQYYLYYSISSFGKNQSAIGLATNRALDPDAPEFEWIDHGIVIQSRPGADNWNAIDPNLAEDENGAPYLSFGSFWSGLKIGPLTEDRTAFAVDRDELITIASRSAQSDSPADDADGHPLEAGKGAIEGPFIIWREGSYYLFASTGYCCRGRDSTYRMIVGRSDAIAGPYRDREGVDLAQGGGTLLMAGDDDWAGVGHNAVYRFDDVDYLVFHGYDARTAKGLPKLRIERLAWEQGWPVVAD